MYHLKALGVGLLLFVLVFVLATGLAAAVAFHPNFVLAALAIALCYLMGLLFMSKD